MTKTDPYLRALGHRIAMQRKTADLSQEQLAERAGLSVVAVSRMERGAVNPSVLVLRAVATGLGVALPRLVAEPGQLDLEVAALLSGRTKIEQARALALVRTLLAPLGELEQ